MSDAPDRAAMSSAVSIPRSDPGDVGGQLNRFVESGGSGWSGCVVVTPPLEPSAPALTKGMLVAGVHLRLKISWRSSGDVAAQSLAKFISDRSEPSARVARRSS